MNKVYTEYDAEQFLKKYVPVAKSFLVKTDKEAVVKGKKLGYPLVLKLISKDALHKSDVGGVILDVSLKDVTTKSQELIARVSKNMPEAKLDGVLVMQMAPKSGNEMILGVSKAEGLGTMVMVGLGGIYVEVFKDVNFGFVPLAKNDALRMITNLKSAKIFEGVRGAPPSDVDALAESLGRLAQLVTDFPQIKELDINPILLLPKGEGVRVLDARIVLEEAVQQTS